MESWKRQETFSVPQDAKNGSRIHTACYSMGSVVKYLMCELRHLPTSGVTVTMSRTLPRLFLYAFLVWRGTTLHLLCFYSGAATPIPSTIRYVDSGPESLMPHVDTKRNTVHHPQVVYDMPKSTQVYVAPHHHLGDNEVSTPRSSTSDNYRKDFAHGARPGHSLASSDSELSQPATRRVSRHQHHSRYDVHMSEMC